MLTAPEDSPDSQSDMGRILIREIRPVPLCLICLRFSSLTTADPVSRKCPCPSDTSTLCRIASQNLGTSCHSSINLGVAPSRSGFMSISAISTARSRTSGSERSRMLFANCLHVVVFPHHFGPSTRTAPMVSSFRARITSAILLRYFDIMRILYHNSACRATDYAIWTRFTMPFGRSSLCHLDKPVPDYVPDSEAVHADQHDVLYRSPLGRTRSVASTQAAAKCRRRQCRAAANRKQSSFHHEVLYALRIDARDDTETYTRISGVALIVCAIPRIAGGCGVQERSATLRTFHAVRRRVHRAVQA